MRPLRQLRPRSVAVRAVGIGIGIGIGTGIGPGTGPFAFRCTGTKEGRSGT
ncbi:hypothetical protein [Streptomyces atratus]